MCFKGIKGTDTFFKKILHDIKRCLSPLSPLSQDGFFLVEVLLVIVILSVSLTLIVQSLLANLRVIKYNKEFSQAITLIENKMNDVLSADALGILLKDDFSQSEDKSYEYDVKEEVIDGDDKTFLKEIKVGISWKQGVRTHGLSLVTYSFVDKKNEN